MYTSGSTGAPKGVMITHGNLVSFTANLPTRWGFTPADRLLALTTITFDIAGLELLCTLLCGVPIVVADEATSHEPDKIFALLAEAQITALQLTPSRLKLLLAGGDDNVRQLANLRVLLLGGEPLPPALLAQLEPILPRVAVFNVYGPTETTIWSTSHQLNDGQLHIGRPLLDETVWVLDGAGGLCPIGVVGEICIGGAGVGRGYWQQAGFISRKLLAVSDKPRHSALSPRYCIKLGIWGTGGRMGIWSVWGGGMTK
jgi:non-ribosomal peptide synthetase component F